MPETRRPRHRPNRPVTASSGEGREIGLDDREIPGGLNHLVNHPTPATKPEVPASPDFDIQNAHGVEPTGEPTDRPDSLIGEYPPPVPLTPEEAAVPVYQVQHPGKGRVFRRSVAETVLVLASKPVRIVLRDTDRVEVQILNEDPANDVRFAWDESTLLEGRGALLWHGTNSYTKLTTQDDVFAMAVTANVYVSVITTTEVEN